ncbi:MAG: protein kinase, partial [Actinomycetota bacterium]
EAMTRTSTTIGTPLYMAPEATDQRGAGPASDVYALGAILFEMLVGSPPFYQGGTFAVLRAHAETPPPRIAGIPGRLTDLIDTMLAKDPAARPGLDVISATLDDVLADATQPLSPIIAGPATEIPGAGTPGPVANTGPAVDADATSVMASSADPEAPGSTAETIIGGAAVAPGGDLPPPGQAWAPPAAGPEPHRAPRTTAGPAQQMQPPVANVAGLSGHGPDRVSRRAIEIGAVLASLAAVAVLVFVLTGRDGGNPTGTGEETVAAEDPSGPSDDNAASGDGAASPDGNNDDGNAGQFGSADDPGGVGSTDDGDGTTGGANPGEDQTTTTGRDEQPTSSDAATTTEAPTTTEAVTTTDEVSTTEEVTTTTEEEPADPLTVGGLQAINITETSARIVWQSSECAISQITLNGDTATDAGWPRASTPCWTSHGRTYNNLQPNTTYTVSVRVADQQGRTASTGPITFTTN